MESEGPRVIFFVAHIFWIVLGTLQPTIFNLKRQVRTSRHFREVLGAVLQVPGPRKKERRHGNTYPGSPKTLTQPMAKL